jgi:hypothetical protein
MNQFVQVFRDLASAGELMREMEQGTIPTLKALGRHLDAYLAAQVPAYGLIKEQCGNIPECTDCLNSLRDKVVVDFARVSGLYAIVDAAVKVYRLIPAVLRGPIGDMAMDASKRIAAVVDLADDIMDADFEAVYANAVGLGSEAIDPRTYFSVADSIDTLVKSMFNDGLQAILGPIEDLPILGPIAKGVVAFTGAIEDTVEAAIEFGEDAVDAVEDFWNSISPF